MALVTTARKHLRMYMSVVLRPHHLPIVNLMNRSATLFLMVSWSVSMRNAEAVLINHLIPKRNTVTRSRARSNSGASCPAAKYFRFESPMTSETCGLGLLIPYEGKLGVNA